MTIHIQRRTSVSAAMIALIVGVAATSAIWAGDRDTNETESEDASELGGPVVPLKDARLKIELNSTDQDVGIQAFIDADPWTTMAIFDPDGTLIFKSVTRGRFARQGGTEMFLESAEPNFAEVPLSEFLVRFPEGNYQIVGKGLKGEKLVGTAKFTHNMPAGPALVSPVDYTHVNPNNTVVRWQHVAAPNGSPIVGYQVLVVKPNSGIPAIPKIILDVMMPATATSMAVPPGFLLPDSEYEWEVLAIETSGNQTLSVGHFRTWR